MINSLQVFKHNTYKKQREFCFNNNTTSKKKFKIQITKNKRFSSSPLVESSITFLFTRLFGFEQPLSLSFRTQLFYAYKHTKKHKDISRNQKLSINTIRIDVRNDHVYFILNI